MDTPANMVRLASGKLRAKRGFGKYTLQQNAKLQKIRQQIESKPEISASIAFEALYQFTELFIDHARCLARSGKKDAARNWYRYFDNSRVVEIIRLHNTVGASKITVGLSNLKTECHPADVPGWETDIQEIRDALREILSEVSARPRFNSNIGDLKFHRVESSGRVEGGPLLVN